ncbi:MAG: hypothetical protein ACI9QL_004924 [Candidatus Omnitrophota bacterium]|jgi:hypothetical protein
MIKTSRLCHMNQIRLITCTLFSVFALHPSARAVDFAHEVLPILKKHCAKCHTNGKYKGGLSMDTRETLLKSETVLPGHAEKSLLVELIHSTDPDDRMPSKGDPLTPAQQQVLVSWINEGLAWEAGFSFKEKTYVAPIKPRSVKLPPGKGHPIDRIVEAYRTSHQLATPELSDDATFQRRVQLDLLGLLPSPEEQKSFAANPQREPLIQHLLARNSDYADHWMSFWNDLLRNDYSGTGFIDGGRKQITSWLYTSLQENKPYDAFVRELIRPNAESEGFIKGIKWRGRVNASQVQELQFAQNVPQVFLGENLKCASCHDSFINDWKLADAYAMAAIVADQPLELNRCDKPTGEMAQAGFLFPDLGTIDASAPKDARLKQLAELMTHPDNGRLSRTIVNRIWQRLMGHGIVHPVDVMGNEPWNEDLLDHLANYLTEHQYDLKQLLAYITRSRTYQEACGAHPEEGKDFVFTGPLARRLSAEQFMDAIWQVTGAGPTKAHAKLTAETPKDSATQPAVQGQWIWSNRGASQSAPAGQVVRFTKTFELKTQARVAKAIITCDNHYELRVNGHLILSDDAWETVEQVDIQPRLIIGPNKIEITGANGGAGGPAGLYFSARILSTGEKPHIVVSDGTWTSQVADAPATLAAAVANQAVWNAVKPQLAFRDKDSTSPRLVRASLVNADLLQRALGRPNREQVVTTRPEELTTLQALELNNGTRMAELMSKGAANLKRRFDQQPREALITYVYRSTLCRPPRENETRLAHTVLGENIDVNALADFLWMVFMLPEFQVVY